MITACNSLLSKHYKGALKGLECNILKIVLNIQEDKTNELNPKENEKNRKLELFSISQCAYLKFPGL